MIAALRKRPLFRPLFIWITGILLQAYFHIELIVAVCLFFSLLLLLIPNVSFSSKVYSGRRFWGIVFIFLLLAISSITTEVAEFRLDSSALPGKIEQLTSDIQQTLAQKIDRLNAGEEEKSVLATLTIGYKQTLDYSVRQRFSATGVSHILAVSGFHVAVICSLLSFVLCIIPFHGAGRWIRSLLLLILVWSYVGTTGLAASSVRAGVMFSFFLVGRLLRRRGDSYNTLYAAALCMLVYNPFYLFDIGFQLSFTAVWFILFLQPRIAGLIDVRNPLLAKPWNVIAVTLAAQIGTFPLCVYYFSTFSTLFLLVNLPIAFLSIILIPTAIIWLILPDGFMGASFLQTATEKLTSLMLQIVDRFSAIPYSSISFSFGLYDLILSYLFLFLILYYLYKPGARTLLMLLGLVLVSLLHLLFICFSL